MIHDIKKIGYTKIDFDKMSMAVIRAEIEKQYSETIKRHLNTGEKGCEIKNYLDVEAGIKHREIWSKTARILKEQSYENIMKTKLITKLREIIGDFTVSDEESLGYGNIYWRIVRPHQEKDVGPLHRDEWFWNLNPERIKSAKSQKRLKCWIPIIYEKGKNLLLIEPYSHLRNDIVYEGEMRDGIMKPKSPKYQAGLKPEMVHMENNQALLFHDRLIHGGSLNRSKEIRVSIEFTLLLNE